MALYQTYTLTTVDQFLADFAEFAAANNWTVSLTTYNSHNRVHLSQGDSHFELWYSGTTALYMVGCTGSAPASAPTAQPGVNQTRTLSNMPVGAVYTFVSVAGGLYFGMFVSNYWRWSGVCTIIDKAGSWTGGALCWVIAGSGNLPFGSQAYGASGGYAQLNINGGWTPTVAAGGIMGSVGNDVAMVSKQPCEYSGQIVPIPVLLYVGNLTTSSLIHPVAKSVPGMFRCNGGDIYTTEDEIPVGADTYLIMPCVAAAIGSASYHDFLFKLGN